jgi:hypothetical protein
MKAYTDFHRPLAVSSFAFFNEFVRYWGEDWVKTKTIAGSSSNSGRPRKLTDAQLKEVLDIVTNWRRDGKTGPYSSIQQVVKESALVSDIMADASASKDTLRRSLKEFCPGLVYKKLWIKAKLTQRHKAARYTACCQNLEVDDSTLKRVLWIDAKTMYMTIKERWGWVLLTEEDTFETYHAPTKKNPMKLCYYIAVNYKLGPVKLIFYTGTTGMPAQRDPANPYLVSSANIKRKWPLSFQILQCLADRFAPPGCAAPFAAKHQPNNAKTGLHSSCSQCIIPAAAAAQVAVRAVGFGHTLAAVLLPLNFYEQGGWLQHCHVPAVPVHIQHSILMLHLPCYCICLHCKCMHAFQLV